MEPISEGVYERGKRGTLGVRRLIPVKLRAAYPPKRTHVTRRAGATDSADGRARARLQRVEIDAQFAEKRNQLDLTRASQTAQRVRALAGNQSAIERRLPSDWVSVATGTCMRRSVRRDRRTCSARRIPTAAFRP